MKKTKVMIDYDASVASKHLQKISFIHIDRLH